MRENLFPMYPASKGCTDAVDTRTIYSRIILCHSKEERKGQRNNNRYFVATEDSHGELAAEGIPQGFTGAHPFFLLEPVNATK